MTYHDHATAVLAKLSAETGPPQLRVLDGFVPAGTTPPYVVVYFDFAAPEAFIDSQSSDLTTVSSRVDCNVTCHSVGANATAARAVAARVRTALLDVNVTVPGRTSWPVRHIENQPVVRDETTGVLVMDQVDVYRLSTLPG